MNASVQAKLEELLQKFAPGSRLLRAWPLTGGISAQVTALEIARLDDTTQKLVLRQYGDYRLESQPQIATQEFGILRALQRQGLAVPRPFFIDDSGEIFDRPYIVTEFVEGAADFAPADLSGTVAQMAAQLATIHRADHTALDFVPAQGSGYRAQSSTLDESLQEGRIRAALDVLGTMPRRNSTALLHGDYWPGNILWHEGRIAAVIDWEDAEIDDPLNDLGNSRMEFNWAYGWEAAQQFTRDYLAANPIDATTLPYWDLAAALRPAGRLATWATSPEEEITMREGHRVFVEQAFAALFT